VLFFYEMKNKKAVSIKTICLIATSIIAVISSFLFASLFLLSREFNEVQQSTSDYMSWKQTALDVREASDYLTDQVRYYVFNKNKMYMDNYFEEANVTKRRDKAIEVIEEYLPNTDALKGLQEAVERSNALMEDEYYAMRLIVESEHIDMDETYPDEIQDVVLSDQDLALSDNDKYDLALELVIGEKYLQDKDFIVHKVAYAISQIDTMMEEDVIASTTSLKHILIIQRILIIANILIIGGAIFFIYFFMVRPINSAVVKLQNHEDMELIGAREYLYLASVYNEVKEQSNHIKDKLIFQAEHDQLTGLLNRTGYDAIYRRAKLDKCYYILIDVDYFKKVNDEYGHEIGDKVLIKVASAIDKVFDQDNEFAFRLGGDEFAVLVEHNEDITADELVKKCEAIPDLVHKEGNKIPDITLSMGIAKGTENDTTDTLFKKADTALYSSKRTGRHCITVYTEGMK